MGKVIMFSPVGGTDPISLNNWHDGSMLHICRVYKPDEVFLYMSHEVLEHHKKDNRYIYCIDKLSEIIEKKIQCHIIERDELIDVQRFDIFYTEFTGHIKKIVSSMQQEDTLLLNVSSGTPAMKSALMVITTLGEFSFKAIQVNTPLKKMNEHSHEGYDVELLWEGNEDNAKNFINRCEEIECPSLLKIKNEEIIKKHIKVYDYEAAIGVMEMLKEEDTIHYTNYIRAGFARQLLEFNKTDRLFGKYVSEFIPIRQGDKRKYFEYALILDIKQKKGQYADFIRAITPLVRGLFELILKHECNISLEKYTRKINNVLRWDENKLRGCEIDRILNEEYNSFNYKDIYSDHLRIIIINLRGDNVSLVDNINKLREVETKIRNLAAHEIVSITEETIKNKTGYTCKQIMSQIKKAFSFTGININNNNWNSYDKMNEFIINRIEG